MKGSVPSGPVEGEDVRPATDDPHTGDVVVGLQLAHDPPAQPRPLSARADGQGPDISHSALVVLGQCSPLPLVQVKPGSALIGPELQDVATATDLCHKEPAQES